MSEKWGIAELAKEFGITTRTIRFYEDQGLIKPERQGQRRTSDALKFRRSSRIEVPQEWQLCAASLARE